jgi:hypothetical protein
MQGGEIIEGFGEPRGNEITPIFRVLADEEAEGGLVVHPLVEVTGGHGELIEVGEQGQPFS